MLVPIIIFDIIVGGFICSIIYGNNVNNGVIVHTSRSNLDEACSPIINEYRSRRGFSKVWLQPLFLPLHFYDCLFILLNENIINNQFKDWTKKLATENVTCQPNLLPPTLAGSFPKLPLKCKQWVFIIETASQYVCYLKKKKIHWEQL